MKKTTSGMKRKPFLTPVWLAGLAAVAVLSIVGWLWGTADSTTVIVIRHAEKVDTGEQDPPLSAAGEARAALLARLFGTGAPSGRISAIYVSPLERSRMTAAPLAAALGLKPIEMPADDTMGLVRRVLKDNSGGRILIVGHADTVPQIVAALSGYRDIAAIGAQEYDRMYIVTIPGIGRANVLRLSY
ncbi:MAG: phosphoglycerate mutase family protein [Steroidobacterales bacterium]